MRILWRLAKYGLRYRWRLTGAYASMVAAVLFAMVIPRLLGSAIDQALTSGLRSQLLLMAGGIVFLSVLRGIFGYAQNYLAESVSQLAVYDLRNDFFRKLQSLSFGFHDSQRTGDLMSKATSDVEAVRWFLRMGLVMGVMLVVMVMSVAVLMFSMNWRLALISLSFVPVIVWRATVMARSLIVTWMRIQAETGNMTAVLQESLAGMRVAKAFGAREYEEGKFEKRALTVAEHQYTANRLFASQGSAMTFFFTLAMGAILWFGGREVVAERLTEGELLAFMLYMGILAMPVRMSGWIVNVFAWAASSGRRLFDVLDAESPVKERPGAIHLREVRGHVKFEGVSFAYDSGTPAIRDIDLDVAPGRLVAILGAPGSGKSTIVHLIPRFYDVTAGRVTIDGFDIRDVTLESLRGTVGIVFQDVFVFGATLRENIAYGADAATSDDMVRAASAAQLHEFAESLPDGYDTLVGERGVTLSGGQRQRLAIARTLLTAPPPILILDDSTSNVDVGTEYQIQWAIAEVVKDRTTFLIAHRLSTVRNADLILVMDQGRIVERGTHRELIERDGFYRRIYDLQLRPREADALLDRPGWATGGGD